MEKNPRAITLFEIYEGKYFKRGDSILESLNCFPCSSRGISLGVREYSPGPRQRVLELELDQNLGLSRHTNLEVLTKDQVIESLKALGFQDEAERIRNPPTYIFNKANQSAQPTPNIPTYDHRDNQPISEDLPFLATLLGVTPENVRTSYEQD